MSITVKEVLSKRELALWVDFPTVLYRGNENFVPFLRTDELETFSKAKNPAYEFCETRLFLAYRDGRVVGRIAGLLNHAYNKKWNKSAVRFTRFDFIDDLEVSGKLLDTVAAWGKERGMNEIMGPIGFTDMDHEGMLTEGFDEFNMSITFYNHPYYPTHMERLGLVKAVDWIEYKLTVPDSVDLHIEKMAEHFTKKNGYSVVTYSDRKLLYKEAFEAFKIVDIASSVLYGTVPLTDAVIKGAIDGYIPLVNLDYICSVKDKDGKIVGFSVMVPSIAGALKKSNGRLFPLGIVRMLKALSGKNDTLEMFFVAVDPECQMHGVPLIMMNTLLRRLIENGVRYCETGPMLETNTAVHGMWRFFNKRQHKRRRCYIKEI